MGFGLGSGVVPFPFPKDPLPTGAGLWVPVFVPFPFPPKPIPAEIVGRIRAIDDQIVNLNQLMGESGAGYGYFQGRLGDLDGQVSQNRELSQMLARHVQRLGDELEEERTRVVNHQRESIDACQTLWEGLRKVRTEVEELGKGFRDVQSQSLNVPVSTEQLREVSDRVSNLWEEIHDLQQRARENPPPTASSNDAPLFRE